MVQSIERFMKQAIVDKDPSVSSAALTSALVGQLIFFMKCIRIELILAVS